MRSAFSNFTITIEDEIADGDRLVARWTARGEHSGVLLWLPATGAQIEHTGIHIIRIEDCRIVDDCSRADELGLLRQVGMAAYRKVPKARQYSAFTQYKSRRRETHEHNSHRRP